MPVSSFSMVANCFIGRAPFSAACLCWQGQTQEQRGFLCKGVFRKNLGVVCTITGPGVTNIATPVANAYADSLPLLVISSSLPRASTGRPQGKLHEVKDQLGMMEALAGWTRAVEFVEEIPTDLCDAFRVMRSGRPQAAYLQIPLDLFPVEADIEIQAPAAVTPVRPAAKDINAVVSLLRESQRPLIVA